MGFGRGEAIQNGDQLIVLNHTEASNVWSFCTPPPSIPEHLNSQDRTSNATKGFDLLTIISFATSVQLYLRYTYT